MLVAKCLHPLPHDICRKIKEILTDTYYIHYDAKTHKIYIDSNDIIHYYDQVYDEVNTLLLFNPKIEVKMHYSNQCRYYDQLVFFESDLQDPIIENFFNGLNLNKVILSWERSYF
jgi:hypothetical protein